jgi:heme exporter protein B
MIAVFRRDLLLAVRSGGGMGLAIAFFCVIALFIPLGIGADTATLTIVGPGILWIGAMLSTLLSLDRLFQIDLEDGTLEVLATSAIPGEAIVLAKAAAHWVTTGLVLSLTAPVLGLFYNLDGHTLIWVGLSLLVGTPALSLLGAFGAALTVGIKRGGLLLSLLVLPFCVPTLIFGAQTAILVARGSDNSTPFLMLSAVTLLCLATMPFAAAAALRIAWK